MNTQYPWDAQEELQPGEVPEFFNPVADYVTFFTVPERMRGEELHVDPAVFANRAQLLAFVDDPEVPDNPLAEGWRFEVVGRTIIERFYVP